MEENLLITGETCNLVHVGEREEINKNVSGHTIRRIGLAAGLAQSVECLTADREVEGSIPGVGPILRVLK